MARFEWKESYSVGVQKMDEQHKHLIALLNELDDGLNQGFAQDVLKRILFQLNNYTMTHFATEEALMVRTKYPALAQHQYEHEELIKQLKAFMAKYQNGSATIGIEVFVFLRDWLLHHIAGTDKLCGAHISKCGIQ